MGDKWRNVEMASLQAAYDRNDGAGAAQIRDQILQLQHAGANQNIQNAYAALQTGNGVAAAQFLAKAHAFIPDNVMGRFGVDKSGKVWGEMLDEGTGKPVGKAFPIDSNSLGALMVQTRDINKFNALTTQNEKEQAQIKFTQDHGNYYGDLIQARQEATQERATAATQRVNALNFDAVTRANAATANAYMRQRGALGGGMVQPAKQSDINKELANPAMTPAVNAIADPSMRSAASSAYNDLRGSGHSTQDADHYLGGLMAGQYVLRSMPGSPFGYVTTPDKRPVMGNDGRPVKVSPHVADMLRNSLPHAQANQAMRHSALTMGAASSAYPPSSSALH
jgi:hypothetical protein